MMAKERKIKQVLQRKNHKSLAKQSLLLTWCIFSKLQKSLLLLKINNIYKNIFFVNNVIKRLKENMTCQVVDSKTHHEQKK